MHKLDFDRGVIETPLKLRPLKWREFSMFYKSLILSLWHWDHATFYKEGMSKCTWPWWGCLSLSRKKASAIYKNKRRNRGFIILSWRQPDTKWVHVAIGPPKTHHNPLIVATGPTQCFHAWDAFKIKVCVCVSNLRKPKKLNCFILTPTFHTFSILL